MALPRWKAMPAPKRGEILYRYGALMAEHKERLARAMTREMGKVIAESRGDVQEGIDIAFLMAGEGRRMSGETVPSEPYVGRRIAQPRSGHEERSRLGDDERLQRR